MPLQLLEAPGVRSGAPVAHRAATPPRLRLATMRLHAVRQGGAVIDFVWDQASPTIAPLVRCNPEQLRGQRMLEADVGPLGHRALVTRYARVLEDGIPRAFEQVHLIGLTQVVVVHFVRHAFDGVAVTLTRQSGGARAWSRAGIDAFAPLRAQARNLGRREA